MKIKCLIVLLICGSIISCCPPAQLQTTASWVNKDKLDSSAYNTIFVAALTTNVRVKATIEDDIAAAVKAKGFKAMKSIDVFRLT